MREHNKCIQFKTCTIKNNISADDCILYYDKLTAAFDDIMDMAKGG